MSSTEPGDGKGRLSPAELWQQAKGDRRRYLDLMREHGHLLKPGDDGYEDASPAFSCGHGWRSKS